MAHITHPHKPAQAVVEAPHAFVPAAHPALVSSQSGPVPAQAHRLPAWKRVFAHRPTRAA